MNVRQILKQIFQYVSIATIVLVGQVAILNGSQVYEMTDARFHGISFGSRVFDWHSATDGQRLHFLAYSYEQFVIENQNSPVSSVPFLSADADIAVIGKPLVYPNPMSMADGGVIAYELNRNADVGLKIYDMLGSEIFSKDYFSGELGAIASYNKLPIHDEIPYFLNLKHGVYFFLLVSEGNVIGKGKFLLRP